MARDDRNRNRPNQFATKRSNPQRLSLCYKMLRNASKCFVLTRSHLCIPRCPKFRAEIEPNDHEASAISTAARYVRSKIGFAGPERKKAALIVGTARYATLNFSKNTNSKSMFPNPAIWYGLKQARETSHRRIWRTAFSDGCSLNLASMANQGKVQPPAL